MSRPNNPKGGCNEIICLCNNISREKIENAITSGAKTLNEIFDRTTAGVGPCGGSCRRKLGPMLDTYLETGVFPVSQKPQKQGHGHHQHSQQKNQPQHQAQPQVVPAKPAEQPNNQPAKKPSDDTQ